MNLEKLEQLLDTDFIDAHDNWKACCPFHDEKSASFFLHKTDLVAHCFGCGVAGLIDTLVARKCGISPQQARKVLELEFLPGLLRDDKPNKPRTYPGSWIGAWRRIKGHKYLSQRGFHENTIEKFEARWDPATKRVVFPLYTYHNHSTTVVGAVGRSTDDREPKWFYYWQTPKSQNIFRPKNYELGHRPLIIVEGVFDVMWLYQQGFKDCCAILGAKASREQIKQIKLFAREVIIALDNDFAGHEGGLALGEALKSSCSVSYAKWPIFAKDICDLSKEQVIFMLESPITRLEKKLYVQSNDASN